MKEQTLLQTFLKYVSANVLGMIGLSCYILADTFFIARGLGPDGLTALNLAIPIYSFIHGTGLMIGMGGSTKYSILKAENIGADTDRIFFHAAALALVVSVIFAVIGGVGSEGITQLLGANEAVYEMTDIYLKVILLFSPAFMMNNVLLCFVRNDGNPRLAMTAMLVGSFANIILDYIFIFPFHMGIFGAVIATGFSPVISMCIMSQHFIRRQNGFRLKFSAFSIRTAAGLCSLGLPSLITELASGIVIIAFNFIILSLAGNLGVAAYGIIANLALVITAIFTGIAQGMQPVLSNAHGMGRKMDISRVYRYGLITSVILAADTYVLLAVLRLPVIGAFNKTGDVQLLRMAEQGILLYFTAFPFVGFNIITATMFSSTERAGSAFIISIMRGFVVILPLSFLLSAVLEMTGVWLSFPATEIVTAAAALVLLVLRRRGTAPKKPSSSI